MNLNSYIALIGGSYREVAGSGGLHLRRCEEDEATFSVRRADYVMTLDADSLVLSEYAMDLIHIMNQPGNDRIALAQTPYLAIPNSQVLLERVAGATTDLHYAIHQGMSYHNAAFWVGPNALIRHAALLDVEHEIAERGHRLKAYIQDWTVIEDTASTIDLIKKGWLIYSHMAQLVYSATPSDFGALVIQRRRWANGGLLVLPELVGHVFRGPLSWSRLREGFLRSYTLTAQCVGSVSMLCLIFYSSNDISPWILAAAAPYYLLHANDLLRSGYSVVDVPRIYALNLALVPVLIGGTLQSLQQAVTGAKGLFKRTPKITGRTSTPVAYIISAYGLLIYCAYSAVTAAMLGKTYNAVFSAVLCAGLLYSCVYFIGLRASWEDITAQVTRRSPRSVAVRSRLQKFRTATLASQILGNMTINGSADRRSEERI